MSVNPNSIAEILQSSLRALVEIEYIEEIDSTNSELKRRLKHDPELRPVLLIAGHQTSGRGRSGKDWLSIPNSSLLMSLYWPSGLPVAAFLGLPLVVGILVVETLSRLCGLRFSLKWPNDIILLDGKLGGILVEAIPRRMSTSLVIGMGLNLSRPTISTALLDQPISALYETDCVVERESVVAALLDSLAGGLSEFEESGFEHFAKRFQQYDYLFGKLIEVRLYSGDSVYGRAKGIDSSGRLIVDINGDLEGFDVGEVSVRSQ